MTWMKKFVCFTSCACLKTAAWMSAMVCREGVVSLELRIPAVSKSWRFNFDSSSVPGCNSRRLPRGQRRQRRGMSFGSSCWCVCVCARAPACVFFCATRWIQVQSQTLHECNSCRLLMTLDECTLPDLNVKICLHYYTYITLWPRLTPQTAPM